MLGVTGVCVDRGRNEQPGQRVQDALLRPQTLWEVALCPAASPSQGLRGSGFRALGQAGEGSLREARLQLFSPSSEPRWNRVAGRRAQTWG